MGKQTQEAVSDLNSAIYNYINTKIDLEVGKILNTDPTTWPAPMELVNQYKHLQACVQALVDDCKKG